MKAVELAEKILATEPEYLRSTPRTHMAEGDN